MDKWILSSSTPDLKGIRKRESLWTQGNGYIGVRAAFEEDYVKSVRDTLINGVFDRSTGEPAELVNIPDAVNFSIEINGEVFTMQTGEISGFCMSLNMQTGEFERSLVWKSPHGQEIELNFRRIVSDSRKHIMAECVEIKPRCDANIRIVTGIDGKVTNSGVQHFDNPQKRAYPNGIKGLYQKTLQSDVGVAVQYILKSNYAFDETVVIDRRSIYSDISVHAEKNVTVRFEKFTAYASDRDFEYIERNADLDTLRNDGAEYLNEIRDFSYEDLYTESAREWKKFWDENLLEIRSNNPLDDRAVLFAQYHLNIMASSTDNRLGIGGKGLTGEGYGGHSFWDTEIFILPYYLVTRPEYAKRLLEYRYKLLDTAEKKAEEQGYEGAMYPWESAWITDGDESNRFGDIDLATGKKRHFYMYETEIHITAGIAYAVWQYWKVTNDKDFMDNYGNEIIVRTAVFWVSRAIWVNNRYEIHGVIGPDEYKEFVNNNAYTNYMAQHNLNLAWNILKNCPEKLRKKLEQEYDLREITEKIGKVADNMYLPKAETDGIISQFDGCKNLKPVDISSYKNISKVFTMLYAYPFAEILKMQVFKQADVVMLFYLMREKFTKEEMEASFKYYEERTLHDSSLSMCIHSLVAARLGMGELSKKMFHDCCCVDLGDNTDNSDTGIHSASIGGIWLAVVMGFGGLNLNSDILTLSPVLPEGFSEYSFHITYRGRKLKISVNKDGVFVDRIFGETLTIKLNGKMIQV